MADHRDHAHTHSHDPVGDDHGPSPASRLLERAVRELLIGKGVVTAEDIRRQIDLTDSRNPAMGAKIVARAWVDPAYRARLLENAKAAANELGVNTANAPDVVALENRPGLHHLVVCTLCSCYPRAILGIPPAWYKSNEYRARAVKDPRGVLKEFGTQLPPGTEAFDESELAALVTRDCMIGVTLPRAPAG